MNKGDLINKIAESTELTKAQSAEALNAVMDAIAEALKNGDKITLVGFGTFSVSERAARSGRNPQTGKAMDIQAKKSVKFKAGKDLLSNIG
jgi:DNA-binding protein HU-beta